jgi:hypothetical protein
MHHNPSEIVPFSFEFMLSEKEIACVGVEKPGGWKPTLFVDTAAASPHIPFRRSAITFWG